MHLKVIATDPIASDPGTLTLTVRYTDVLSMVPEYLLQSIVDKIVDKFVEIHYAEIEKEIDPKLVAAIVALQMGMAVEEKMLQKIESVQELAHEALRRAKRR